MVKKKSAMTHAQPTRGGKGRNKTALKKIFLDPL
jgi:hypothetical protein